MQLNTGDIIFTFDKNKWISKAVWFFNKWRRDFEETPYISHVAMVLYSTSLDDRHLRTVIAESCSHGVKLSTMKKYDGDNFVIHVGRYKYPMVHDQMVSDALLLSDDYKYGFNQIASIFFNKLINRVSKDTDPGAMICSEFISEVYRKQDITLVPGRESAAVTPLGIFNSELIDTFEWR